MNTWVCVDSDTSQYRYTEQLPNKTLFHFIQVCDLNNKIDIAYDEINVEDCYNVAEEILNEFGHESLEELQDIYGDAWQEIVAEYIFEDNIFSNLCYMDMFFTTVDEASNFVKQYVKNAPTWYTKEGYAYDNDPDAICYKAEFPDCFDPESFFTKNMLITLCQGDTAKADRMFDELEWQSPYTVLNEWEIYMDEE